MTKRRRPRLRLNPRSAIVDILEQRVLLSASLASSAAGKTIESAPVVVLGSISKIRLDVASNATLAAPFSPINLRAAYGVSSISFNGTPGDGTGQTIAIVDAFNDPDIISDTDAFSSQFGLPQFNQTGDPTLQVLNENGGTSLSAVPNAQAGTWDVEESLDVQWAHSIAPNANIILYEANSSQFSDLLTAVQTAASATGVSTVSMSWGGSEFAGESSYDSYFTTPARHQGVTFLASTGDAGAPAGYPAYSPNVVAVGGTSVTINSSGTYDTESAWADAGGGVSTQESIPSYQVGNINGVSSTNRAAPDVSMDADPNTGVYVLDSYYDSGYYLQVGGTSLAAPMWAGLISIADQGRALAGLGTFNGATQTLPALYGLPSSDFHDITSGNNGFAAGPGYDLATGLGSPVANLLVPGLAGYGAASSSSPTITTNPISQSVTAGTAVSFNAAATGNPAPTVQWDVSTNGINFTTIAGATNTTLNLGTVTTTQNGYEYEAIFTNTAGTATTSPATLTVAPAATGTTASLSGSEATAAASYNLTTLGTSDWAHWGRSGNSSNFDHDASGGSQISNVTKLGPGSYGAWTTSARKVIWTNGTPTASNTGDDGYLWANNAIGAGYSFTVPASTTSRTLYVYLGGASAGGTLDAHLSDGSAVDYKVSVSSSGNFQDLVAITYNAASAGQTLTITYDKSTTIGSASGSVDLIAAWLTGAPAASKPGITTNPQSQSVLAGTPVTFTAAASGSPTPTVQWDLSTNGGTSFAPISGATSATLSIGTATLGETGYEYEAIFTNAAGTAATSPATLTVTAAVAPTITTNPQSQSVVSGTPVSFSAAASGTPAPTVQWELSTNGGSSFSPISGATAATLSIGAATTTETGYEYEAVFTNSAGPATTNPATLTVTAPIATAPTITTNPQSQSVTAGTAVSFTAAATGTPTPTVQWELSTNGGSSFSPIAGATAATLSIGAATTTETGYEYEAVFTNSAGPATTNPATLTVTPSSSTGSITGTSATAAASYNLTTLGTSDWAHWGRGGNASNFDHDKSGGSQISNVTKLGPGSYGGYSTSARKVSWTNGTPTSSDSADNGYIWANNALGAGYSFTVPASTTSHTLYIYLGGASSGGTLTASLSDNSAAKYSVTLSSSGNYQDVVAITYHAASAGQTLTLSWAKTQTIGSASGSVDLIAAWLQ